MQKRITRILLFLGIFYVWSFLLSISLQTIILCLFILYFIIFELKTLKILLRNRVILAFLLFYGEAIFTSLFSKFRLYALGKIIGVMFDTFVPYIMGYIISMHNLDDRMKKHGLLSFILLSSIALIFYLYSPYKFSPLLNRHGILTGFLGGKLTYAGVISSYGGIIFERITSLKDIYGILSLLLLVISLSVNTSRSYIFGILSSFLAIGLLNLKKYYKHVLIVMFTLTIIALSFTKTRNRLKTTNLNHPDTSIRIRLDLWKIGIKLFKVHPLFSIGFEVWPKVADSIVNRYGSTLLKTKIQVNSPYSTAIRGHFHNTYIQMAINGGIFLLIFYLYFIFTMLEDGLLLEEPMKSSFLFMFIIFLFAGFFEYNFSDAEVTHAFFFFSGIYLQKAKK